MTSFIFQKLVCYVVPHKLYKELVEVIKCIFSDIQDCVKDSQSFGKLLSQSLIPNMVHFLLRANVGKIQKNKWY